MSTEGVHELVNMFHHHLRFPVWASERDGVLKSIPPAKGQAFGGRLEANRPFCFIIGSGSRFRNCREEGPHQPCWEAVGMKELGLCS